jgi:hypothetical protein
MQGSDARNFRRPSVVAQYADQIAQWLREEPAVSAVEILERVRRAGYRGGKSALYELVRRVKIRPLAPSPAGTRQLIVVARDREYLYNFLRRAFEDNEMVQIVSDRRLAERRKHSAPQEGGKRQGSRRSQKTVDGMLRAMGWTVVHVSTLENRRRAAS